MQRRAYSVLDIKSTDADKFVIEGVASTPTPDRYGDIVDPMGAKFKTPMPLLWQHNASKPVGEVTFAKATKDGIPFRASIRKPDEFTSETLRERALEAWESVKTGLVRAVSIGFTAIEYAFIENGGIHFTEWEWLELSLVTIPAQAEATITTIKHFDQHAIVGARSLLVPVIRHVGDLPPGARALPKSRRLGHSTVIETEPRGGLMKTVQELEAIKAQKLERMAAIETAATDEGRTMSDPEHEEHKALGDDVEAINRDIEGIQRRERLASTAKVVDGSSTDKANGSRSTATVRVNQPKLDKGIAFAQFAMAQFAAKGDPGVALRLMEEHYPQHPGIHVLKLSQKSGMKPGKLIAALAEARTKANIPGGTTADGSGTAALLAHTDFAGDFLEYLRPRTLIGQFGSGNVPALRRIPFNVHIKGRSTGSTGYWVGEGQPKPVVAHEYADAYHGFNKVAAIEVLSDELMRFSDPAAEALTRDALAESLIAQIDTSLVDTVAASTSRPAGLLNGVSGTGSTGGDSTAITEDMKVLWAPADAANLPQASAVYMTTPAIARSLSLMRGAVSEQRLYPEMTALGGTLDGVPVLVSNYVPAGNFILVFASEIYYSDDNTVTVDASQEATIEMVGPAPENSISDLDDTTPAPTPISTGASFVSMFQTDSTALRAHRYINWSKRRATAVERLTGVDWGAEGS